MTQEQQENPTPSTPPLILVIDDEEAVLKLVKTLLKKANYEVVTSKSSEEAFKLMEEYFFDCVVTDIMMPGLNGFDFVKTLRGHAIHGDIPILMLTRKRDRQDVKKAVEVGVTDYIVKPIDEHLLLEKVQLCLKNSGSRKQVFELSLYEDPAQGEISFNCQVVSLSESTLTIRLPFELKPHCKFDFNSALFDEIGIKKPILKVIGAQPTDKDSPTFDIKFSFLGSPEEDLKKIRAWLQREAIRRRK